MSDVDFVIPLNQNDLLETTYSQYFVTNLVCTGEIKNKLKDARDSFKNEGSAFILDSFDTYYSVLHHGDKLSLSITFSAYDDLHKAVVSLNRDLGFLLEDKNNINDDVKKKYLKMIKMLLYIYVNIVNYLLGKKENDNANIKAKKNKKTESNEIQSSKVDEKQIVHAINNIIQREINLFWNGQYVDETFITMVAETVYQTMQCYNFKTDKDLQNIIFHFVGTLIKNYSHGDMYVVRVVHMIKSYEHIVSTVATGIQLLIENYNCANLLHAFIKEMCELLAEEKVNENQGTKSCSTIMIELAINMPTLMMPEVLYLNKYLAHESHILRNSILTIIVEIILAVLNKQNLSEEEKEDRELFLNILQDHILDINGLVRAKVFSLLSRLQEENALPIKTQINVLDKAVQHLRDKVVAVRKSAVNCIKVFITHNIYGADLSLQHYITERDKLKTDLEKLMEVIECLNDDKFEEWGGQWTSKVDTIKEVIEANLEDSCEDVNIQDISISKLSDIIRIYVQNENYLDAFKMCKYATTHIDECVQVRQTMNTESEADFLLTFMHYLYTDFTKILKNLGTMYSDDDIQKITELKSSIEYFENCVKYIEIINGSIPFMNDLLDSQYITDFHIAMEFFVIANNFNMDNAPNALLNTLKYMEQQEQDRKDAVMNAFKETFLITDAKNIQNHKEIIVKKLTFLLHHTSYGNYNNLAYLISAWSDKGTLDNNVIDMLWQIFTRNNDDTARSALELLKMASINRSSILTRNIKLITTIVFKERKNDFLLVKCACDAIAMVGNKKQLITDENPPFRVNFEDELWQDLSDILTTNFLKPEKHFLGVITSIIYCIYSLCSKPEKLCDSIIQIVCNDIQKELESNEGTLTCFMLIRIIHLFGEIAIRQFHYLDENIYKEMKRRNYVLENKKNKNRGLNTTTGKSRKASEQLDSSISTDDMSFIEGAQAEDTDANFIINVLENNVVNGTSVLSYMTNVIVEVCNNYNIYNDKLLQTTAVAALGRYMLVSSKFCKQYIHLFFAILDKTPHISVKIHIIMLYADLLERFPNVTECCSSKLFDKLNDENLEVRRSTFCTISQLVLKDVIRVQKNISEMTIFLVAKEEELRMMSKEFFSALAAKGMILYNVLPDIFSHIGDVKKVTQDEFTTIMTYLFGLLDKAKYIESLTDRFCIKFQLNDDEIVQKNAAFCLSLIQCNEKFLKRLSESFHTYKHALHNKDVYASFKTILRIASADPKAEMKNFVTQIESKINNLFEVNDANPPANVNNKKTNPVAKNKKSRSKRRHNEDSSDDENNITEPRDTHTSLSTDTSRNSSRPRRNVTTSANKRKY